MRIAALGRTGMLLETIHALVTRGHDVPLVATCEAAPEYSVRESDFADVARDLGADFFVTNTLNDRETVDRLRLARCDVAVSVNWLTLVGAEAIAAFPHGIWNAHAGTLPQYRGNAPVAWAMLDGADGIGVTVHQMDPAEVDAGPIITATWFPITNTTYIAEVFAQVEREVPPLFIRGLDQLAAGTLVPRPQDGRPLRCYPRRPEDGRILWAFPAYYADSLVRVSAEPFAGAYCDYNGERLTVWRAHGQPWQWTDVRAVPGQVAWRNGDAVGVATADGWLVLTEVEYRGQRGPASAVIRSNRDRLL